MLEAESMDSVDEESALDALALSALLSSRICHDLINPVGAINSGLEVLDDPEMDGTMRDAALDLIKSGAGKAIALLSYARLAYGAAGGYGAQISLDDAKSALVDLYATLKPDLEWRLGGGLADKDYVKVLLTLAYAAAECVPRGGLVDISGDEARIQLVATGKKLILQEDLRRALSGDASELAPKYAPALIARRLVDRRRGAVNIAHDEESVVFEVSFGQ